MKKITKKVIALLLVLVSSLSVGISLSACSSKKENDKISIAVTIFPVYDWVMQVLGDNADKFEVTMLLTTGVDLHNYQPTADDIVTISTCDMFVYVGGHSDSWVDATLNVAKNKDMKVVNLFTVLGDLVKKETCVGVVEEEHEHEHDHEHDYDEHIWLSLKNASVCCEYLAGEIATLDSENAQSYAQNGANYVKELNDLDKAYSEMVASATCKTLVFCDRFPFRYLLDDYGISYYAAFSGCSAESEASFEVIAFLATKIDENALKYVMIIDGSDGKIANTVIDTTTSKNATILTLNSIQSITSADIARGISYLSIMQNNLSVLTTALN